MAGKFGVPIGFCVIRQFRLVELLFTFKAIHSYQGNRSVQSAAFLPASMSRILGSIIPSRFFPKMNGVVPHPACSNWVTQAASTFRLTTQANSHAAKIVSERHSSRFRPNAKSLKIPAPKRHLGRRAGWGSSGGAFGPQVPVPSCFPSASCSRTAARDKELAQKSLHFKRSFEMYV